jgi:DNA ligase-1
MKDGSEFAQFALVGEAISKTPAKLEKVRILAEYLRSRPLEQLPIAAVYLSGRAFPQNDLRTLQVGWSVIVRALQAASQLSDAEVHKVTGKHGDAGKAAREILEDRTEPEPFGMVESRVFFESLQRLRGPIAKVELLQKQLRHLSALEGAYVVKILTSDLRIGLKEGLVEEAIARAFEAPLNEVKEANMLLGDIGETAARAAAKTLATAELSVFRPIKSMLASPEPTAAALWARFTEAQESSGTEAGADPVLYVEDKFDGIRAQLHRTRDRVEIFSRDLRKITDQFGDLAEPARSMSHEVILDGEIIAYEEGRRLTFFDLQKRLGRKNEGPDLFASTSSDVPVVFVAFDLLWLDGRSLLRTPLRERRKAMKDLRLPPPFQSAEVFPAHSAAEIDQIFEQARARANEGLMVKDPESLYSPGRRGLHWFKLKKELATLDVVVVAAELGHGKRNHVLSDYTFAVRDEDSGELLPIGKAYSGLTDAEIAELTKHFSAHTLVNHGRYREVKPDTVLEIAFDSIQPSNRHASGLALRFPRIKAIRRDKTVEGIDTLAYARELAANGGFEVGPPQNAK